MNDTTRTLKLWLANDYDIYHGARYAMRNATTLDEAADIMQAFVDGLLAPVIDVGATGIIVAMMRDLMGLAHADWHAVAESLADEDAFNNDDEEE